MAQGVGPSTTKINKQINKRWLMLVILATQEAESKRVMV
jgi:hypothetical protein